MGFRNVIFFLSLFVNGVEYPSGPINSNQFIIKVRKMEDIPEILGLELGLKFKKEVIPRLCVFYKDLEDDITSDSTYLSYLKQRLKDKVEYIEQAKLNFEPIDSLGHSGKQRQSNGHIDKYDRYKRLLNSLVLLPPYYGLGIPEAWQKGNEGRGVVIGMTDVGVVTDIPDFRDKIDIGLSKSFVIDNWGLEPTDFPSYPEDVWRDHGNNCAGLIIGIKNNSECTVGVAYAAKLAVLKIFSFAMGKMVINESQIADALVHELDRIHIYSNSWSTDISHHFYHMPLFLKDVLEYGTVKGRYGRGRIHVFPTGGLAGGFANSPYTITVNAVGTGGRNSEYSPDCACVLTTAYGDGHTNSSNEFITPSWNHRKCTDRFRGTSPATAVVAGIIALLLQNNEHLTWREVQYLIIQSSSMAGIQDANGFVKNAAGRFYHGSYGYGLINATKLVSEAKRIQKLQKQEVYTSQAHDAIVQENTDEEATWKLHIACPCYSNTKESMTTVEQVVVKTSFTTHSEMETELIIISPSHTKSYLMRSGQSSYRATTRENAEFLSVHFWGEEAVGNWTLLLRKTTNTPGIVFIQSFEITLYGPIAEITDEHNKLTPGVIDDITYFHWQHELSTQKDHEYWQRICTVIAYLACLVCICYFICGDVINGPH